MIIVCIHTDIFILEFAPYLSGNLVGQGQGPVAYAAQCGTFITLAPIAAVAGIHRDAVAVGAILKILDRVIGDQSSKIGIADT